MEEKAEKQKTPRKWRWLKVLGVLLGLVVVFLGGIYALSWTPSGASASGERLERMSKSPQWKDGHFFNKLASVEPDLLPTLVAWIRGAEHTQPTQPIPIKALETSDFATPPVSGLRITWFGHSSLLVEIEGKRILVDPVWGERTSPFSFTGPARFHETPIALGELPPVDAVIISHDHYDHLDHPTITALKDEKMPFVVPLGIGAHLEYWGVAPERIVELDWWESHKIGGLELVSTPSRHFSGRDITMSDRDATLWTGWALIGAEKRVYYSGDTAMFPGFKEIGERLGPFDATMIEVGAYNQMWADVHLGPEQALLAHQDVRGKVMIPVHWGTFDLALHAWTEPIERVLAGAREAGIQVAAPRPGESIEPTATPEVVRWWPELPWQSAKDAPVVSSGLTP